MKSLDRNYSLLLAQADSADAAATMQALQNHGHSIVHCTDGEAAWQSINDEPLDLVIVDLDLPGTNGLEVLGRMAYRDLLRNLPVVVIGRDDADLCDLAFAMGATLYVPKPTLMPLLTHTVWCVLSSRARDQEVRWLRDRLGISPERRLELAY